MTPQKLQTAPLLLLVDDEKSQRDLLSSVLSEKFRLNTAASVDEAVIKAELNPPDLVIMDYSMPEATGIDGLLRLREIHPSLPLIFLTGHPDLELARSAIGLGASEFMLKPFEPEDLVAIASRLTGIGQGDTDYHADAGTTPYALQRRLAAQVDLWRGNLPTVPSDNRVLATFIAGNKAEAKILRLSRRSVLAEVYDPYCLIEDGASVERLQVWVGGDAAYDGPAHLAKVMTTGVARMVEFSMHGDWINSDHDKPVLLNGNLESAAENFVERWRTTRLLREGFVLAVADAVSFLSELRSWLEGIELVWTHDEQEPAKMELLLKKLTPSLNSAFSALEYEAAKVPDHLMGVHAEHLRSNIHPLVLCSPFVHRCFVKPLGYPGDYGMMNQMLDSAFEGDGLFARIINAWVIRSGAGDAYRNRVDYLENSLGQETTRVTREHGRKCRVLSLGCGAAREAQNFVRRHPLGDGAEFTFFDFSPDTIRYAGEQVLAAAKAANRNAALTAREFSVQQMLAAGTRLASNKQLARSGPLQRGYYDLVYCAGLFDYLSDRVCRRLLDIFQEIASPGAAIIISNFTPANPIRRFMDYVLDWRLIYRTEAEVRALVADTASELLQTVHSPGNVEVYMKLRKPAEAMLAQHSEIVTTGVD